MSCNPIWQYFRQEEDKSKAKCIHCGKIYSLGSEVARSQTLSGLKKHLAVMHPVLHSLYVKQLNERDVERAMNRNKQDLSDYGSEEVEATLQDDSTADDLTGGAVSIKLEESNYTIVDFPGRSSSACWNYFGFYSDGVMIEKNFVVCRICRAKRKYNGNTSNMLAHLGRVHPELHVPVHGRLGEGSDEGGATGEKSFDLSSKTSERQTFSLLNAAEYNRRASLPAVGAFPTGVGHVNERSDRMTVGGSVSETSEEDDSIKEQLLKSTPANLDIVAKAAAEFICTDLMPITVLDGRGFQNFFTKTSAQSATLQSLSEIKNKAVQLINNSYLLLKVKVKAEISLASAVSVCVDNWTSSYGAQYLSASVTTVTANNSDWKQSYRMLDVRRVYSKDKELKEFLSIVYNDWLQDFKNERVNLVVCRSSDMLSNLPSSTTICCFGFALESVINRFLKNSEISELVDCVRYLADLIVEHLASSEQLHVLQSFNKDNMLEAPSNWIKTLNILQAVNDNLYSCSSLFGDSKEIVVKNDKTFNLERDAVRLSSVVSVIKPFIFAARALTEEFLPPASLILPVVSQLKKSLLPKEQDSAFLYLCKSSLSEELEKFYSDDFNSETLMIASFLDPRFKDLSFLTPEDKSRAYKLVYEAVKTLQAGFEDSPDDEAVCKKIKLDIFSASGSGRSEPSGLRSLFEGEGDGTARDGGEKKKDDAILDELSRYVKSEKCVEINCDVENWWRIREELYPHLNPLVLTYLSLPATVRPPSISLTPHGVEYTNKRSQLDAKSIREVLFIHHNGGVL